MIPIEFLTQRLSVLIVIATGSKRQLQQIAQALLVLVSRVEHVLGDVLFVIHPVTVRILFVRIRLEALDFVEFIDAVTITVFPAALTSIT